MIILREYILFRAYIFLTVAAATCYS